MAKTKAKKIKVDRSRKRVYFAEYREVHVATGGLRYAVLLAKNKKDAAKLLASQVVGDQRVDQFKISRVKRRSESRLLMMGYYSNGEKLQHTS